MLRPLHNHGTQRLSNDDEHEQSRQCNGPSHLSATHKSEQTEYVYYLHTLGRFWGKRPLALFTEFVHELLNFSLNACQFIKSNVGFSHRGLLAFASQKKVVI